MKKPLLIAFLLLIGLSSLQAQEATTATLVTSSDQLLTDNTYLITAMKNKKYYCDFHFVRTEDAEKLYDMQTAHYYNYPVNAAANSDLLTLKNIDGRWYLYSTQHDGYLSPDTVTHQNIALMSNTPGSSNAITFEDGSDGLILHFGNGTYLWLNDNVNRYIFGKTNNNRVPTKLFLIEKEHSLTLDDAGLDGPIDETTNVKWIHSFKDGYYNTLCVPFDIADYHAAFGASTKAYKLNTVEGNTLSFSLVSDAEPLSANTPYLIKGPFNGKDTISFTGIRVHTDSLQTPYFGNDTVRLQGCYTPVDHSLKSNEFILYKDQFISCSNQRNLKVLPFHWYVQMKTADPSKAPRLNVKFNPAPAPYAREVKKNFSSPQ